MEKQAGAGRGLRWRVAPMFSPAIIVEFARDQRTAAISAARQEIRVGLSIICIGQHM